MCLLERAEFQEYINSGIKYYADTREAENGENFPELLFIVHSLCARKG